MGIRSAPSARWPDQLEPYVPVRALADATVRLAFNESSLGPFPAAREAIAARLGFVHRYPERDGQLIARLATLHAVVPEMIALGNGGDAIIGYLSSAFLRPGDEIITGWPSFPTYVIDALKQDATVVTAPLVGGAFDLDAIADRIGSQTRLIWVCSPNNPTGGVVSRSAFRRFINAIPEDVLVVVDEAYHEFAAAQDQLDTIAEYVGSHPNVAALRTFSKLYGLAGLRVGYLVGPPQVITAVGRSRHYYDISELGAVAAIASLDCPEELERRRALNRRRRRQLEAGLSELALAWHESQANFVAVGVRDAESVAARLLAGGIATRSLSSLGAPHLLRVTVGSEAEIELLLARLGATIG